MLDVLRISGNKTKLLNPLSLQSNTYLTSEDMGFMLPVIAMCSLPIPDLEKLSVFSRSSCM